MLIEHNLGDRLDALSKENGKHDRARRRAHVLSKFEASEQPTDDRESRGREQPVLGPVETQPVMERPRQVPVDMYDDGEKEAEQSYSKTPH